MCSLSATLGSLGYLDEVSGSEKGRDFGKSFPLISSTPGVCMSNLACKRTTSYATVTSKACQRALIGQEYRQTNVCDIGCCPLPKTIGPTWAVSVFRLWLFSLDGNSLLTLTKESILNDR